MVRKLNKDDKKMILNFLMEESTFNLFIIGDVINSSFDEEFLDLWGEFDENSDLILVLLRYFSNFIPYYKDTYNGELNHFINIVSNHKNEKMISGKTEIVSNFTNSLTNCTEKKKFFCELKDKSKLLNHYDYEIKEANINDSLRLFNFINSIEELKGTGEERGIIENNIKTGSGRYYYIENNKGKIISVAGTSAENRYAAMVVSVATHPEYRKRGLAVNCVSKLCSDTLTDCEKICLFYDNPSAGKVYHGIGFETIGNWTMAVIK